jgi:hypothetical protein
MVFTAEPTLTDNNRVAYCQPALSANGGLEREAAS